MDVLRVEGLKAFYIVEGAGEQRAVKAVNDVSSRLGKTKS